MTIAVLKFGGTSVADAAALRAVQSILRARAERNETMIVVLSATSGTTNTLLSLARMAAQQDESTVAATVREMRQRHADIIDGLIDDHTHRSNAHQAVDSLLNSLAEYCHGLSLLGECTPQSLDEVVAYGERISSSILAAACDSIGMRTRWLDARQVIRTDARYLAASVDMAATQSCWDAIWPTINDGNVIITQGFIGSALDGTTTTLGRGGSDYSAALFGAISNARIIDIYTDVSGVLSADPRIVSDAKPIAHIDVDSMRELALYGAKVLHPDTIIPAVLRNIPVRVANTFEPSAPGTIITAGGTGNPIVAITGIENCLRIVVPRQHADACAHALERGRAYVLARTSTLTTDAFVVQITEHVNSLTIESLVAGLATTATLCSIVVACSNTALTGHSTQRVGAALSSVTTHDISWFPHGRSMFLCVPPELYHTTVRRVHSELALGA
jgi:aspartate kinase